jgi:hypothetical protein
LRLQFDHRVGRSLAKAVQLPVGCDGSGSSLVKWPSSTTATAPRRATQNAQNGWTRSERLEPVTADVSLNPRKVQYVMSLP